MSIVDINRQLTQMQSDSERVYFDAARRNLGSDRITRQGFYRLILAQLQNQDPTSPMENVEFMSQQLQMEQVNMTNDMLMSNRFGQAAGLAGKIVQVPDASWNFEQGISNPPVMDLETGAHKLVVGQVEAVQWDPDNQKALLLIDGNFYDMDLVQQVFHSDLLGNAGGAEETEPPAE